MTKARQAAEQVAESLVTVTTKKVFTREDMLKYTAENAATL